MRTINDVLDRVKQVQHLKSDYKLSLTVGISESSLSAYRKGVNLPDEINCKKLAVAMGEDPELLTVEMQAQRAKTEEARQIWLNIAKRMQMGFADVKFALVLALFSVAAIAGPAWFAAYSGAATGEKFVYYVKRRVLGYFSRIPAFVKVCKVAAHVSRNAHPAAFRPA